MSADWKRNSENTPLHQPIPICGYRSSDGDGAEMDQHKLDAALQALAAECQQIQPDARLRTRISRTAEAQGLLGSADEAQASYPLRDWWWIGTRASGLFAALGLVTLALWMPWWTALRLPVESPLPGRAAVVSAPAVPQPGKAMKASAQAFAPRKIGVRPLQSRAMVAAKLPKDGEHMDLLAVPADVQLADLPSPASQWPPEVLAAARQMVEAERAFGQPGEAMVEAALDSVRVRMGADELWRMGLSPVPAARGQSVLADFLVSEEGRPLAVRLVGVYP